jgi:PleD family two-component response regulator
MRAPLRTYPLRPPTPWTKACLVVPVIFVTAYNHEAAVTMGLDNGATDFNSKPLNPNIVRARVRTQLTLKAKSDPWHQWAIFDGLSGVFSRRHFDERLPSKQRRAGRTGLALSVVLRFVDFSKRYNDHFGH